MSSPDDPHGQPPAHLRAWEALPWIANGRATPAQQALVAAHLPQCAGCREELAWQQRLCAALAPGAGQPADAEPGLQALLARLDEVPEAPGLPAARTAPPRGGRRLVAALAAAVVVQAVGLVALGWPLAHAPAEGAYQTLSSTPAPPAPAAGTLRVRPDPGLSLAGWQALLQAEGLQVVGGPNSAGAWILAPAPAPGTPARTPADTLAALRAHPAVQLAEPIGPP